MFSYLPLHCLSSAGQLSDVVSSHPVSKTPDLGCSQVACLSDGQSQRKSDVSWEKVAMHNSERLHFSLGQMSENGNIFGNLASEAVDIQLGLPKKKLNRKGLYSWAYHKMETYCKGIGCSIEEMRDRCRAKAREVVAGVEF